MLINGFVACGLQGEFSTVNIGGVDLDQEKVVAYCLFFHSPLFCEGVN